MKKILALILVMCTIGTLMIGCTKSAETTKENSFPEKEITVIVPWNAGGGNDIAARQLQPIFKDMFGVELVIKNVSGGSSAVGITQVINAKPDGYTLGFATSTYIGLAAQETVSPTIEEDFENICVVMEDPIAIVCKAGKYETLEDFVNDAKSRSGEAVIALSNTFGVAPVYSSILNEVSEMNANIISYDSGSRCVTEVLGGHVDVSCSNYTDFVSQVQAGEMKVLALMTEERAAVLPDVPTIKEAGYDVFTSGNIRQMSFMMAPKGIDPAIKEKLADMFKQASQSKEYQDFASERNFISSGIVGEELNEVVKEVFNGLKDANSKYFQ